MDIVVTEGARVGGNDKPDFNSARDISVTVDSNISGIDASLSLGSRITGKVTNADGAPLADISVALYQYFPPRLWWSFRSTVTSITGTYSFDGLSTASYRVSFYDKQGNYINEFYNGKPDLNNADDISVTIESTINGIDATLDLGGRITGKVTDADGVPLGNVTVYAHRQVNGSWQTYQSTTTNISGTYDIAGLPANTYRVYFAPSNTGLYTSEFYNDALDISAADDIVVTAGNTVGSIDATLDLGAHITGKVTDADGVPLGNVTVYAHRQVNGSWQNYRSATTNISGTYDIAGLPADTYRVYFSPSYTDPYRGEYYKDTSDIFSAEDIVVTIGSTVSNINAALTRFGQITGKVTSVSGSAIGGVTVSLLVYNNASGTWWSYPSGASTSETGIYTLTGLTTSNYRIGFQASQQGYITEYYNDKLDVNSADDISVTVGSTVAGVDAVLALGAQITGTVTNEEGMPIPYVSVNAYRKVNGNWVYYQSTPTDLSGSYNLGGLPADTYRLRFSPSTSGVYLSEYYNDKADINSADDIVVASESTVGGVNAVLTRGGEIRGKVTSTGGSDLSNIEVALYRVVSYNPTSSWWVPIRFTSTSITGTYSFGGLEPDVYRIGFQDNQQTYIPEYYNDLISVTVGSTVAGVDAVLALGARINGKVTDANAAPIPATMVTLYRNVNGSWQSYHSTTTSISGTYSIGALPANTYRIQFSPSTSTSYMGEYYNDKPDLNSSDDIDVTAESTVGNIDAVLALGAEVRGKVIAPNGADLEGISAVAYRYNATSNAFTSFRSATTSISGTYRLMGLPSGDYVIGFHDSRGVYVSEYYDDVFDADAATHLTLSAPEVRSDIDAVMSLAGSISGTVTGADNQPLTYVKVTPYQFSAGRWVPLGTINTDSQGRYTVAGLNPGNYRLYFQPQVDLTYAPEYYNNVTDLNAGLDGATDVAVTPGTVTPNINVSLAIGGRIQGKVTTPNGADPSSIYVYAARNTGSSWEWTNSSPVSSTGAYEITGLADGVYRVYFGSYINYGTYYGTRYYGDVVNSNRAKPVIVNLGQTVTGIDIEMAPLTGAVQGTITTAAAPPYASLYVNFYDYASDYWSQWSSVGFGTDASGQYTVSQLATRIYRIVAGDSTGAYAPKYFESATSLVDATNLELTSGMTLTAINLMLEPAGFIAGKVNNSNGQPISRGYVTAYRYEETDNYWTYVTGTNTDNDGNFVLRGLSAGFYKVRADDQDHLYARTYWGGTTTLEDSPIITVSQGVTVPNVSFALTMGGRIRGKVTTDGNLPVSNISVYAYWRDGISAVWVNAYDTTDRTGNYELSGLPAGNYQIEFYDGEDTYPDQYYNGLITVASEQTVSGIDAVISSQGLGIIQGKVVSGDATPLGGVRVVLYSDYGSSTLTAYTDINGLYHFDKLRPGNYKLYFTEPTGAYAFEYFNDAKTFNQAQSIAVNNGQTVNNVDTVLSQAAQIEGNISQMARNALDVPLIQVTAYYFDGTSWQSTESTSSSVGGYFVLKGLPAGTYRLRLQDMNNRTAIAYFGDSTNLSGAADIAAVSGQTTTISQQIQVAGQIQGTVQNNSGTPMEGISIDAYRQEAEGWMWMAWDRSGPDGRYTILGLPAGNYRVKFTDSSGAYVSMFYGSVSQIDQATDVAVTSGTTTPNIDTVLAPVSQAASAEFTGTPTSGTAPLTVQFTDASTGSIDSWAWNFGDGETSTAQNPSHTYDTAGTYTVTLTVSGSGGSDTSTRGSYITVSAPTPTPQAGFTGTPTSGTAPLTVQFTDASTGSIDSWAWNFGDGGTSTAQNPAYVYTKPGTYSVSLSVTGVGGSDIITHNNYIVVDDFAIYLPMVQR